MDSNHQHFLVVGPVEDPDATSRGQLCRGTPEVVVRKFLGRRLFERVDFGALRAHTGHHVLDHVIFSSGIHALKHQQQRVAIVSVQQLLQRFESLEALLHVGEGIPLAGEWPGVIRTTPRKRRLIVGADPEPIDVHIE